MDRRVATAPVRRYCQCRRKGQILDVSQKNTPCIGTYRFKTAPSTVWPNSLPGSGASDVNPAAVAGATGVVLDLPYSDIDTAFANNTPIRVARLGSSCVCRTFLGTEGDATVEEGDLAWLSNDASGYWMPTHVSGEISAGTALTGALIANIVGRCAKYVTTTDGDTIIAHLLLSV